MGLGTDGRTDRLDSVESTTRPRPAAIAMCSPPASRARTYIVHTPAFSEIPARNDVDHGSTERPPPRRLTQLISSSGRLVGCREGGGGTTTTGVTRIEAHPSPPRRRRGMGKALAWLFACRGLRALRGACRRGEGRTAAASTALLGTVYDVRRPRAHCLGQQQHRDRTGGRAGCWNDDDGSSGAGIVLRRPLQRSAVRRPMQPLRGCG